MPGLRGVRLWLAALLLLASALPALAEKKVALVIGNSTYKSVAALTNPRNDAADVATVLRDLGFEVVERIDVEKNAIRPLLKDFSRKVADADTALVYYAGHALQYQGHYYLVPVDADFEDPGALKYDMLATDDIRDVLDKVAGVRIMIFDACRNDPFGTGPDPAASPNAPPRGLTRGLTRVVQVHGSVTAYATAALDIAEDGTKRNSPFTRSLLKWMHEPGLEINQMFQRVRNDVYKDTNQRQLPEVTISLLEDYYLNKVDTDKTLWARIRYTDDPAVLRDFLTRFPGSDFSGDARYRLEVLDRGKKVIEEFRLQQQQKAKQEQDRIAREAEAAKAKAEAEEQQRQREARDAACTSDAATINQLLAQGRGDDLTAMRGKQSLCSETTAKIDASLAQIAASRAREAACTADATAIGRLQSQGRSDELTKMKAKQSLCPDTTAKIDAALADIAAAAAQAAQQAAAQKARDAACTADTAAIEKALAKGAIDELTAMRGKQSLCPDTASKLEAAITQATAAAQLAAQKARDAACNADIAAIDKLQAKGPAAIDELKAMRGKQSLCPDTPSKLEAAIAQATAAAQLAAQKTRDAACSADAAAIDKLQAKGASAIDEMKAMRGKQSLCPDTASKLDAAIAMATATAEQIAALKARDAACSADLTAIEKLQAKGSVDELTALRGKQSLCPDTPSKLEAAIAQATAAAQLAAQKARDAACTAEAAAIDKLQAKGPAAIDEMKAMRGKQSLCPDTAAKLDVAIAQATAAAQQIAAQKARDAACAEDASTVARLLSKSSLDELTAMRAKPSICAETPGKIDAAIAQLTTAAQQQAAAKERENACIADKATIAQLLEQARVDELTALRAKASICAETPASIDAALAELAAAQQAKLKFEAQCRQETNQIAEWAGTGNSNALLQLKTTSKCADTAANVDKALAAIEVRVALERQRMSEARAAQCQAEADKIKSLIGSADSAGLAALRSSATCLPETATLAAAALEQLTAQAQVCTTESAQLMAYDEAHLQDIKTLASTAKCPDVARKAADLAQRLQEVAQAREIECSLEKQELDRLTSLGEPGREQLRQFSTHQTCAELKPLILAAIGPTPVVPPQTPTTPVTVPAIDTPEQLKTAAKSLRRLGCFVNRVEDAEPAQVHDALKAYYREKHDPNKSLAIDDTILARLEAEPEGRICPLVCPGGEHENHGRCVVDKKPEPKEPRRREPVAEPPKRQPRTPVASAPTPAAPSPSKPKAPFCTGC